MPLLNYTSNIDADKSASLISKMLSKAGASSILTDYDPESSQIVALSFKMTIDGKDIGFRLPCDWRPVYEVMWGKKRAYPTYHSGYSRQQSERKLQAVRTAWKITHDWVQAQLAIIETRMVRTEQVFLPYMMVGKDQTLYQQIAEQKFLLGEGK